MIERLYGQNGIKINHFGSNSREWVWKSREGKVQPHHIKPTLSFGGVSFMVWGRMTNVGCSLFSPHIAIWSIK